MLAQKHALISIISDVILYLYETGRLYVFQEMKVRTLYGRHYICMACINTTFSVHVLLHMYGTRSFFDVALINRRVLIIFYR